MKKTINPYLRLEVYKYLSFKKFVIRKIMPLSSSERKLILSTC